MWDWKWTEQGRVRKMRYIMKEHIMRGHVEKDCVDVDGCASKTGQHGIEPAQYIIIIIVKMKVYFT